MVGSNTMKLPPFSRGWISLTLLATTTTTTVTHAAKDQDLVTGAIGGGPPRPPFPQSILGGSILPRPPAPGSRPYLVSLRDPPNGNTIPAVGDNHRCGASLISPRVVLTAAHCLTRNDGRYDPAHSVDVNRYYQNITEPSVIEYPFCVTQGGAGCDAAQAYGIVHPNFVPLGANPPATCTDNRCFDNDVALIILPATNPADDTALVIAKNDGAATPSAGEEVQAMGWGGGSDNSNVPWTIEMPYIPNELCQGLVATPYVITENMLCLYEPSGLEATCPGDSGGPTVVDDGATQVGIVSFGFGSVCDGEPNRPIIFARVSALLPWIAATICDEDNVPNDVVFCNATTSPPTRSPVTPGPTRSPVAPATPNPTSSPVVPATPNPTTSSPITPATPNPTTAAPITPNPTTPNPVAPATPNPTTAAPNTPNPTTPNPVAPATPNPTTANPATPSTPNPTTPNPVSPATSNPTTSNPVAPATPNPATPNPVTPATPNPTTPNPAAPSTPNPTPPPSSRPVTSNPVTRRPTARPSGASKKPTSTPHPTKKPWGSVPHPPPPRPKGWGSSKTSKTSKSSSSGSKSKKKGGVSKAKKVAHGPGWNAKMKAPASKAKKKGPASKAKKKGPASKAKKKTGMKVGGGGEWV